MNSNEFYPYAYFTRVLNLWWLVALGAILGGFFGFIFYHLNPPIYEATATYVVTIDLSKFPIKDIREDMIQYNEDLALNTTKVILLSPEVLETVTTEVKSEGISITSYDLLKNNTIERKHDLWELRYRNQDPSVAQKVVNTWADIGYQAMLSWHNARKAPDYVIFRVPSRALLPQEPVIYDRNKLMFAGAIFGFIIGILISNLLSRAPNQLSQQP